MYSKASLNQIAIYVTICDKTRLPCTSNCTGLKIYNSEQKYSIRCKFHLLFYDHITKSCENSRSMKWHEVIADRSQRIGCVGSWVLSNSVT